MSIIGNNLLILREALGMLQSEVSDKTGISREYISKIEIGSRTSVSQDLIKSLCFNLGTTEQWLTKNEGWAYDPETTWKAHNFFERQIEKFQPDEIIIITYSDHAAGVANGFVFIRPNGVISMAGEVTRAGYLGGGPMAYEDALTMIKDAKIKVGHIKFDKKDSGNLVHMNLMNVIKRANYDKNIIEKQLYAARFDKYPNPEATPSIADAPINLTNDEIELLLGKMRESKTDIQDLIRYMDKKSK